MLGNSSNLLDSSLRRILKVVQPARILELGCGEGKFGQMLRDMNLIPGRFVAVQRLFTEDDHLRLRDIGYQEIINADLLEHFRAGFDESFDMVVALDVIEHFLYSDVLSIINFALYRSDYMLLVWPSAHPQAAVTHSFDRHRSSFELRDLSRHFDVVHYSQTGFAQLNCVHRYHIALLRGHLNLNVLPPVELEPSV